METLTENSVHLQSALSSGLINRTMETFYNPLMRSNRNIAILLLNSVTLKKMNMADPLAGSGIRSLRFLNELKPGKINHLFVNDMKENFSRVFKENMALNKIKSSKLSVFHEDASLFLMNRINDTKKPDDFCGYFDYIDIDPFGSPNPYLNAAIARIARQGIIAVTATDTAALTGTYPQVTRRKYWAESLRNYMMHETGLRILIRKVQLLGIQFDKALTPILSYSKDHYFRMYLQAEKGKEKCDKLIAQHQYFLYCPQCLAFKTSALNNERCSCGALFRFTGPLWIGLLADPTLISSMAKNNPFPEEQKFLDVLNEESTLNLVGFYDLHVLAKKCRKEPPRMEMALRVLKGTRTHFSATGIKTKADLRTVVSVLRKA